jgi:hypothetical protein
MRDTRTTGRPGTARGDPLKLLRHTDAGNSRPTGRGLPIQVRAHHVELAGVLGEPHHRDVLRVGQSPDRVPEPVTDPGNHRRGRNREPLTRQELHDLPTDLQVRHIPIEVNPIQALQIQRHMTIKNIPRRHRASCHHTPPDDHHSRQEPA